jgi:hypothetical protein
VSGAASLRCDQGEEPAASGRGIATTQRSEASVAWAREERIREGRTVADEGHDPVIPNSVVVHLGTASPPPAELRGIAGVGAKGERRTTTAEVTTTTRAETRRMSGGAMRVLETDDNYDGGDDNYPRVVMKMRDEGREEGRGRDRQK